MIIVAAVKFEDGRIFVGKRFSEAVLNAYKILGIDYTQKEFKRIYVVDDGFITSDLKFLNRKEALIYAEERGQFKQELRDRGSYDGPELFSEDLW
jgi:hypothetical protein